MIFPFVSRAHHVETVELLKEQFQKCDTERRQLLNYITGMMGRGLFEEVNHPTPTKEVADPHYISQVRPNARSYVKRIQEEIDRQVSDAESDTTQAANLVTSTIEEGIAAAKGGK